ncbi:MAG: biotin/lipoyl-binding protein [Ferruginibacter sp.]|nr:biotin/lipoyl-binding protein [Cytophagales bacterium]
MPRITVRPDRVFEVSQEEAGLLINQVPFVWDLLATGPRTFHILYQNRSYHAEVVNADHESKVFTFRINHRSYQVQVQDQFDLLLERMGFNQANAIRVGLVKAPMPGLILDIRVMPGDEVRKGDPIVILEAMKMENIIKSPGNGQVKVVKVQKGDNVEKNQVLLEF